MKIEPVAILAARVFPDERVTPMLVAPREAERAALADTVRGDRTATGRAILAAVDSADPFPLLRALAADLGAKPSDARVCIVPGCGDRADAHRPPDYDIPGQCDGFVPAIVPSPSALSCDMALRFLYDPGGVFVMPGRPLHVPAPRDYDVRGLRVRICYEHAEGEAEAAGEVAASWVGRMLMAGAVSVEAVGEPKG